MPHPRLAWLEALPEGRAWLADLPGLVATCAERWSLTLGEPFAYAFASLALPAETAAGERVVLKVQFPDRESEHEAAALAAWDGDGAVRLLDHDPARHALLLERCEPGTPLSDAGADAALDVLASLLPRLWIPAGLPFTSLADEAASWRDGLADAWQRAGRPFERRLLDEALAALHELPPTQGPQVLLHQDLHAENVLAASREPWLAIDPKPLTGEREFAAAPIVRSFELGHSRRAVVDRLDRLSAALGLDRERARRWTIGQTMAWSLGGGAVEQHLETARWLLDA